MNSKNWIKKLRLKRHPEGGYFRETYRSKEATGHSALPRRFTGSRPFSTAIYYLLESDDFSGFHRIKSDELWHHYDGCNIIIHVLSPKDGYKRIIVGHTNPQCAVTAGNWFAAELADKKAFALAGCTVAPGFDFADFEMGKRDKLLKAFPKQARLIKNLARPARL